MTTLARLGLILEGEIVPCNWIERAFASIVSSIKTVLPTFAYTDIGKSLKVVDSGETEPATVTLIQRQMPSKSSSTRFTVADGTYDWSGLEAGDVVKVTVNAVEKSCELSESSDILYCNYPYGETASFKFMSNGNIQAISQPDLDISTVFVSATKIGEVPVPEIGWDSVREVPAVENADKGKYLHANSGTGALEWNAVNEVPAVETEDKGKYLKANDSTGALEWATAGGGGGSDVLIVHEDDDGILNKTWQEIYDAISDGKIAVMNITDDQHELTEHSFIYSAFAPQAAGAKYNVKVFLYGGAEVSTYVSDTSSGYPQYAQA